MTASKDLARLRRSYERAELDETHSASTPLVQFEHWLHEAVTSEAVAAHIASASARPGCRAASVCVRHSSGVRQSMPRTG